LLGSYTLPWTIQVSGTFQNVPGPQITAAYQARSADIAGSLGRNLAAGATATYTAPLIAPGTMYGDRLNQLDARVTKTIRFGGKRMQAMFDFYNLLNVGSVLVLNNAYGGAWLTPTALLPGRLFKVGMQLDF